MENEKNIKDLFRDLLVETESTGTQHQREILHLETEELPFAVNEALNTLRGNIQLSAYNLKTIAITSALENEGKSGIAFHLAKNMAGLKKRILYIDCDIRNSVVQQRYGIKGEKPGLSKYLCGAIDKEKIVYHTDDPFFDMIFTGAKAPNPSELISGPLFRKLISFLRSIYDYIILDTPPLNVVIDGLLIAKQCDGTILVVHSGTTDRGEAEKAKEQMEYAGVKILGTVLNAVENKGKHYGHYGYGHYGYGYGYGEDQKSSGKSKSGSRKKKAGKSKKR